MKREKKHVNTKQKKEETKSKNSNSNTKLSFLNIWVLIGIIIIIGLFSFFHFFSCDYLFFFKDIGSDSINQNLPTLIHKYKMFFEDNSFWSFYQGMGNQKPHHIITDPYSLLINIINYIGINIVGENIFIYYRFIRLFILHFIFSGIVFYFYQRTLSINKFSAIIGSLLITFSGYMVVGSSWGFSTYIFSAIFLLFAFEQLFLKKRWWFFPFAIVLISNNLFVLFIYAIFLLTYVFFRFFSEKKETIKSLLKLLGQMIILGLVGLLMNAANVYSFFIKMFLSPRVAGSVSLSQSLKSSNDIIEHSNIGATMLLRFFSSDIIGTGNNFRGWSNYFEAPLFYIGILSLLLFPQVFIYLNKQKRIIFGSFLGFWTLTLIFPYLRHAILAFTGDYFRFGFDFFIPFTLLFFAIYSLNQLDKTFKINFKLLGGTVIILLIALFYPYSSIPQNALDTNLRSLIVLILISYSVLLILMSKEKYKIYGQVGILLLLVFELSYFSNKSYKTRIPLTKVEFNKEKGGYADGSIKSVNYIKSIDKTPFYRLEKDYQSGSAIHGSLNDAMAQGYYGTTSYSSFNQLNYVRFLEETGLIQKGNETATRWITGLRGYPLLQTFGNIKYHLSKSKTPEFLQFGFDFLARKDGITILKNRFYLPFGYTYDKYIDADDFKTLVNYKITPQSLSNIYTDLSRTVETQNLKTIINNLKTILNIKYANLELFSQGLEKTLGKKTTNSYLTSIAKYSVSNLKVQTALLNGFVYEKDSHLNINELEKINIADSTKIIPATIFNFKVYKSITDNLKQDTLQITSFKQSEITGNISLNKTKMLFLTIPFDEGWKLKINDKEEHLSRVNFGFTGIILPKGRHKVELYYVPEYSQITNIISIISIISFWLFLVFYFYKRRKIA